MTPLIRLLEQCSGKELDQFDTYLHICFPAGEGKPHQLYRLIRQLLQEGNVNEYQRLAEEKLFHNKSNARQAQEYNLLKRLKEFLTVLELQSGAAFLQRPLLIKALEKRNVDNELMKRLTKAEKNDPRYGASDTYLMNFMEEEARWNFINSRDGKVKNFQSMLDHFEKYAAVQKLKNAIASHSYDAYQEGPGEEHRHEYFLFPEFISGIESKGWAREIPIAFFYHALQLYIQPKEETHFTELKSLLEKKQHTDQLNIQEHKDLLTVAENYCINQARDDKTNYREYLTDIQQRQIELETSDKSHVSHQLLINTLINCCRLEQIEKAKQLFHRYIDRIQPALRSNTNFYIMALLAYYQKQYEEAENHLGKIHSGTEDSFFYYAPRVLSIKIFYEKKHEDDIEPIEEFDKRFKTHLSRQLNRERHFSKVHRERFKNFLLAAERLVRLRVTPWKDALRSSLHKLLNERVFSDKEWLQKKFDDLNK